MQDQNPFKNLLYNISVNPPMILTQRYDIRPTEYPTRYRSRSTSRHDYQKHNRQRSTSRTRYNYDRTTIPTHYT